MRHRWPLLLLVLVAFPPGVAGRDSVQIAKKSLTQAAAAASAEQFVREPWESRARLVTVDLGALPERATAGAAPADAGQITIDLFEGRSITAQFDRFDLNTSGVTWIGTVPGVPLGRVTIVYGGGLMAASISLPDAVFTIRPLSIDPLNPRPPSATPLHVLTQIDQDALPPEAEPIEVALPLSSIAEAADAVMADSADIIELLMVYTALAEAWAGGPAGILNWINLGVSETNSAYATSGVVQRVLLVNAEKVAYTEVSNFSTNLNNLRNGIGGLSGVPALREIYGADLVAMIVRPTAPSACGIAFLMTTVSTAFASSGFSVTDAPCVSPNYTLAHELGHNMGLRHDWYMDSGVTPFTYAHGHVNATARFRTIMSYPDSCSALGITCTRLLAFSNPDRLLNGVPTGVPGGTSAPCPTSNANNMMCDADERRALNETAFAVANFRQATILRPPVIVGHPANQSVARGQQVTLQVAVSGQGPFTYQWYRGASPSTVSPIAGATGATYVFVPGNDGFWFEKWFYWVRVSNNIGPVSSATATITLMNNSAPTGTKDREPARRAPLTSPGPVIRTDAAQADGRHTIAMLPDDCSVHLSTLLTLIELADRAGAIDPLARMWALRAGVDAAVDLELCRSGAPRPGHQKRR